MVLAELKVDNIYIVCGYTDMRKSIAGLSAIIIQQFQMRPDEHSMFLFCGKRADRIRTIDFPSFILRFLTADLCSVPKPCHDSLGDSRRSRYCCCGCCCSFGRSSISPDQRQPWRHTFITFMCLPPIAS